MVPEHDPLIEAAIRPLSDNEELRQAGAGYLKLLRGTHTGGEEELVRRWERIDQSKHRFRGKNILLVILAILTGWVVFSDYREVSKRLTGDTWPLEEQNEQEVGGRAAEQRIARNLDPDEKRLLFGDLAMEDQVDRKAALFASDPENSAFFAEYALACEAADRPLPRDFLATARRIDPDNAWFTYLAAAVEAKNCVKLKPRKSSFVSGKRVYSDPVSWDIKDWSRFESALTLLREGQDQVRYETYLTETLCKRLTILPQHTRQEYSDSSSYLYGNVRFPGYFTFSIANAIAAKAWFAGERKNEGELREAIHDAERFLERNLGADPGTLGEEISNQSNISRIASSIGPACDQLRLLDEAAKWHGIEQRSLDRQVARRRSLPVIDGVAMQRGLKTGIIEGYDSLVWFDNWVVNQPPLSDSDVAPGRYHDHELISRYCCYADWAALGAVICGVSLYRYRTPKVVRVLAWRMKEQLRPGDWAWIAGLGILLPFLFVMAINRFSPWGGRDYGIGGSLSLLPAAQFIGLFVSWLIVPVAVVRWRLAKRLRIFGFSKWNFWGVAVAIAFATAFVPIIGWAATTGTLPRFWVEKLDYPSIVITGRATSETPLWIAAGILAVPLSWLFIGMSTALLSGTSWILHRATTARVLIPIHATAMIVILAVTPLFKFAEEYWFRQDALIHFDPEIPSWSRYEYRIAVQARKELREVMGYDDSTSSPQAPKSQ